jgi:hypothetical protein
MIQQIRCRSRVLPFLSSLITLWMFALVAEAPAQTDPRWKSHDLDRPRPPVVTPAAQTAPVPPPSDAIVLFDGSNLKEWRSDEGGPTSWVIKDGGMQPPCTGEDITSVRTFGDVQLHMEWASPLPAQGSSQGRGNSGVFFMGMYEIQILDSYENDSYPDGQAASIYGQYPPLVNACLPPGEWQTYDIVFRRPRFLPGGGLAAPARATVFHNGVLVQDAVELRGETMWLQVQPYRMHPDRLPITLQDHGNPVRYRNIWVRELRETTPSGPVATEEPPAIHLAPEELEKYAGVYKFRPDAESSFDMHSDGKQLYCIFGKKKARVDLVAHSKTRFAMRWAAAHVEFELDDTGTAAAVTFNVAGAVFTVSKVE